MATILEFQKPDKVIMLDSTATHGKFEFRPLEPGFGITVGNAIRRILLSSLEGYAITSVRIPGVDHEFTSIDGVMEEMIEIILNLKQVRLAKTTDINDSETVTINVTDVTELTAGYLSKFMSSFKVLNPDLLICRLDKDVQFQMELTINKGRGYVTSEENRQSDAPIGLIPMDSIHTPIKNVKYSVENFRVEQKTDYEKLLIEIVTDGSITPKDALKEAAAILIHHFMLFSDERITLDLPAEEVVEEFDDDMIHMRALLRTKLTEHDLSVRALNCLKAADIETLGDLVQNEKSTLLKLRNFGKKSLTEIEELFEKYDISFGMNVSKYKLDKD